MMKDMSITDGERICSYNVLTWPISLPTTWRWMRECGCTYDEYKKTYFCDTHNKYSSVLKRIMFCQVQSFISLRMHVWVCFSSRTRNKLKQMYKDLWPCDELAFEIDAKDVGINPPGRGTRDYVVTDLSEKWYEYHVDFIPSRLRCQLNGGVGGYVSQRRVYKPRLAAPRDDAEVVKLLHDLLVVSSPQLWQLLRRDLDKLVIGAAVRKEFFAPGRRSLGFYDGTVVKRFDDTNQYRCVYSDGDTEDYTLAELLPIMQEDGDHSKKLEVAHKDLVSVLEENKRSNRDEYLYRPNLLLKTPEWFGEDAAARRALCCSLNNFCIFHHTVDKCNCDEGVDPWARSTHSQPCIFRHDPAVCKCNLPAIKFSQDECCFAAYDLQKKVWHVEGKVGLRKKSAGPAGMVSEFSSSTFGFGIHVSDVCLTRCNQLRAEQSEHYEETDADGKRVTKMPLAYHDGADSIITVLMMPGANKDGWWRLHNLLHQCEDLRDVLRVVAPPRLYQYIPHFDNSATHNKKEDVSLSTSQLSAKWGGRQIGVRDSEIIDGCIGKMPAVLWYLPGEGTGEWEDGPKWVPVGTKNAVCKVFTLKVGDIDHRVFQENDPPPFYDLDAPRRDRPMTRAEKTAEQQRRHSKQQSKLRSKRRKLRDCTAELSVEELQEFDTPFVVPGYIGKPKGSRVHTWLRGHWQRGMTHKDCVALLNLQPDYQLETSRLSRSWTSRGHGCTMTPPGHCECVDEEYAWGKSKYEFRNYINTKATSSRVFKKSILTALGSTAYTSRQGLMRPAPLPRRRLWRFQRRANDYVRSYNLFKTPFSLTAAADKAKCSLHDLIERTRKTYKRHRCTGEQDFSFTTRDNDDDQIAPHEDKECHTYLINGRPSIDIDKLVYEYVCNQLS